MIWSPLPPRGSWQQNARAAVTMSASAGKGRTKPTVTIIIRAAMLEGASWLAPGAQAQVLVGAGEHAGMLRIAAGGPYVLGKVGLAKAEDRAVQIKVPFPPGVSEAARPTVPVEFAYSDAWVEVTIPATWRATSPTDAPAPAGAATPPARGAQLAAEAAEIARRKAGLGAR